MIDLKDKQIILASGSPRRRELLSAMDIPFTVDTGNTFDESWSSDTPHEKVPELMSEGKSFGFHRELADNEILVTSDTMVLCGTEILGKPKDRDDAIRMLKLLSGRGHQVITAVTLRDREKKKTFSVTSNVFFKELSDSEITYYLDTYKPYDKAGAYGIQGLGCTLVEGISGDYFNVVGLPVARVVREIKKITGAEK